MGAVFSRNKSDTASPAVKYAFQGDILEPKAGTTIALECRERMPWNAKSRRASTSSNGSSSKFINTVFNLWKGYLGPV